QVKSSEVLTRLGVNLEKFTIAEAREHFPQFNLDGIGWAMLEPDSGVLFARRAVQALVREAIKQGAEYFQATAQAPPRNGSIDFIATENDQRISAAVYGLACGPWLPKIFPDLLADRIHPTRQEVFYFGTPPGDRGFAAPALPTWIDFKGEAYGLPDTEGRGIKIAVDRHGSEFDPDTGDRVVTSEGLAEVRQCLERRLPALKDAPVIEARVCQYENTSNGDFLIDRHPEFENVWLVGGGSGHGFKHGPVVGEYVAARIDGSNEGIEPRFSLATKAGEHRRAIF